jgi:hypothetical protein
MRKRWPATLVTACLASAAIGLAAPAGAGATTATAANSARVAQPKRVVLIVLDSLRPEFINAFGMSTVKRLMRDGVNVPNAYVGHMASETVISHNVMTSGMLPKHMGWADEAYRDTRAVLGPKNAIYITGDLTSDQFDALIRSRNYPKLANYLHRARPGTTVAAIGQKPYALYTMSGPAADMRITFSGREFDCDGSGELNWRGPTGINVPAYLSSPACGRFYINSSKALDYGTATTAPAWMYPFDGNRFTPGSDPRHKGGDNWVADAAIKVMRHEKNWSGLLLTMGAIDKAAHTWGGLNDRPPFLTDPRTHLPFIARNADRQVAKVLQELRDENLMKETLVVLTTDHAQQTSQTFNGVNGPGRGDYNWYYGDTANDGFIYNSPSPTLKPLLNTGNVAFTYQDTAVRTWLKDTSRPRRVQAADRMAKLPSVMASYYRTGDHYTLRWSAPRRSLTQSEWRWFQEHGQEIVNTMAAPYAADVVGLLRDNSSYGVAGDHGGAQRPVQRIPIVFYGAGVKGGTTLTAPMRTVDIMPTILDVMNIRQTSPTDGRAYRLPGDND